MKMKYINDIPVQTAISAFNWTSQNPESRGERERIDYSNTLEQAHAMLLKYADTPEKLEVLESEFERFRSGYLSRTLKYLYSHSRVASSFITGGSNFPVRRMEKRNRVVDSRLAELFEYREKGLEAIKKILCPELRPIMSGDGDAIERLKNKILIAEQQQAAMKSINAAWRKYLKGDSGPLLALGLSEDGIKIMAAKIETAHSWEKKPHPGWELTNLGANIRRMKDRLEQIQESKEKPDITLKGQNATIDDCPADNRVRLTFPGKPGPDVRMRLKKGGFRWTPSLGVWQAYRNYNSLSLAKEIAS